MIELITNAFDFIAHAIWVFLKGMMVFVFFLSPLLSNLLLKLFAKLHGQDIPVAVGTVLLLGCFTGYIAYWLLF